MASILCFGLSASFMSMALFQNKTTPDPNRFAALSILHSSEGPQYSQTSYDDYKLSNLLENKLYGKFTLSSATARAAIPRPHNEIVTIQPGQALSLVLQDNGVGSSDVSKTIEALTEHLDPRHIRAGQEVTMHFDPTDTGDHQLMKMEIAFDPIKTVVVERENEGFKSTLFEKDIQKQSKAKMAKVEVSLFGSAAKAGIPESVVGNIIRLFSHDVDFQRDIRAGDKLEVYYDSYETDDGHISKIGDIHYAKLSVRGKEKSIYRYKTQNGTIDYFGPDGMTLNKTLMRTPVDGARISSGYGMRRHPILGYNKMHKGVDFAAPIGTPIYAAGNGVVEKAGRLGAYGNYIRLRHNGKLQTAYGHLHKIRSEIKPGVRVKQGQVIGYVGSTGRSTGPHLHYEVLVHGEQVNPNSVKLPIGDELRGDELKRFKAHMKQIEIEYAAARKDMRFASKSSDQKDISSIN